jgi:hypothetical protein
MYQGVTYTQRPGLRAAAYALVAAVLIGLATSPPAAASDPAFSQPRYLSSAEGAILHGPDVALGPDGTAVAIWSRYLSESTTRVELVRIGADGELGPVSILSESSAAAWSPKVAVDAEGHVTATWYQGAGSHQIMTVRLSADGSVGPVRTLGGGRHPDVVVDSRGRATIVWFSGGGITLHVRGARVDEHGVPGPTRTLSSPGDGGFLPKAAVDSRDRVTVVWSGDEYVQSVRIGEDGAPGPILNLSRRTYGQGLPDVAVDSLDRVTAVWQADVETPLREHENDWRRVESARIGADGVPEPFVTLSGPGQALRPKVAIDAQDRAVVVWEDQLPRAVTMTRVDADGGLEAPRVVAPAEGSLGAPAVATDGAGGATVAWSETLQLFPPRGTIRVAQVGAAGEVEHLQALPLGSDDAYHGSAKVVIDSLDRASLVWKRSDGFGGGRVMLSRRADTPVDPPGPPFDPPGPPFDPPGPPFDPPGPPFDPPGPPFDPPGPPFDPPGPPFGHPPVEQLQAPHAGDASLRFSSRGIAKGKRLLLRAACRSHTPCSGTLTVLGRRTDGHKRPAVLAHKRYRVAAATHGTVKARLSRTGLRRLQQHPRRAMVVRVRTETAHGSEKVSPRVRIVSPRAGAHRRLALIHR